MGWAVNRLFLNCSVHLQTIFSECPLIIRIVRKTQRFVQSGSQKPEGIAYLGASV